MGKKYMQVLRSKREVQRNDKGQLCQHSGWTWKVRNINFAKQKHLDETPVKRGMIKMTLWLTQHREGKRMI